MTRTLTPLADAYDDWVLEQRARDEEIQSLLGYDGTFRLSSIGLCPRKQIWQRASLDGRPISQDTRRMFHERSILHDHHIAVWRRRGLAIAKEQWVSAALPHGYKGRMDAICHVNCECGMSSAKGFLQISWAQMVNAFESGDHATAQSLGDRLKEHNLVTVEVKTTHPNITNYSTRLPRPHNALQAQAYAWAIDQLYGIYTLPYLYYIPVGGSGRPLEYALPRDDEAVLSAINNLLTTWGLVSTDPAALPDRKPLMLKDRKEKENRVIFLERDWECDPQYCPYAYWPEHDPICVPVETQNKTGDRIAYLDSDNGNTSVVVVAKWARKLGLEPERLADLGSLVYPEANILIIDQPRPGAKSDSANEG